MVSKLGFLLSLFFVIEVVAYTGDMCAINGIYTKLDAISVTAAYQISLQQGLTQKIIDFVYRESGATIVAIDQNVAFGETMRFKIYREYLALIMSKEPLVITVTRSAVIGYLY